MNSHLVRPVGHCRPRAGTDVGSLGCIVSFGSFGTLFSRHQRGKFGRPIHHGIPDCLSTTNLFFNRKHGNFTSITTSTCYSRVWYDISDEDDTAMTDEKVFTHGGGQMNQPPLSPRPRLVSSLALQPSLWSVNDVAIRNFWSRSKPSKDKIIDENSEGADLSNNSNDSLVDDSTVFSNELTIDNSVDTNFMDAPSELSESTLQTLVHAAKDPACPANAMKIPTEEAAEAASAIAEASTSLSSTIYNIVTDTLTPVITPVSETLSPILSPLNPLEIFACPYLNPSPYFPFYNLTPYILQSFHTHLHLPFWACFSLLNIGLRSCLFPVVVHAAKTQSRFALVAPEVQFLVASFQRDFRRMRVTQSDSSGVEGGKTQEQAEFVRNTIKTLRGVFTLNKVDVLDFFKSPLLQIPLFYYISLDIRLLINGSDPILAQQLVESSFFFSTATSSFYLTDLTEPDPYYVLPILTGTLLYLNVETAMGKRSLSGETSSHANVAKFLKDFFQSLAIFMPGFMSQQPSGVQIYLATSMIFTLFQSMALRNNDVRKRLGLPKLTPPSDSSALETMMKTGGGKYLREFLEIKHEVDSARAKGERVWGEGILVPYGPRARVGKKRKSTIKMGEEKDCNLSNGGAVGENGENVKMVQIMSGIESPISFLYIPDKLEKKNERPTPLLPPKVDSFGMLMPYSGPMQSSTTLSSSSAIPAAQFDHTGHTDLQESMPNIPMNLMEMANRGEKPVEIQTAPQKAKKELEEQKKQKDAPIDLGKWRSKSKVKKERKTTRQTKQTKQRWQKRAPMGKKGGKT